MKSSHTAVRFLRAAALLPAFTACSLSAAEAPVPAPAPAPVAEPVKAAPAPAPQLEKTVVVAARREEKLAEVSPSVSVVTADEIETRQLHTIAEALQTQPGVFVASATESPGSNISIFTRGTNSNQTAVLLDGRRLNPGLSGSSEIQRYSLTGLDSVEFARGATSTLYGANALGGVVDMRSINTLKLAKPIMTVEAEGGSFYAARSAMTVAGATSLDDEPHSRKVLGASVSGNVGYTDGPVDNSDFRGNNALSRIEYSPVKAVTFETLTQVHDQEYGVPTSFGADSPLQRQISRGWLVSPGVAFDNGDDVSGKFFYSRSESILANTNPYDAPFSYNPAQAVTGSVVNDTHLTTILDEVSAQFDYKPVAWVLFSTGYSYNRTDYSRISDSPNINFPNPSTNHLAWESNSVWERVTFTSYDKATKLGGGARYQAFDDFTNKSTGEIFASHAIRDTGTSVHGKVATAYSTPNAQDYFFYNPSATKLKPESSQSWEIGLKQELFKKESPLTLGIVYFENRMQDLLAGKSNGTPPNYGEVVNINSALARGVEFMAEWNPAQQVKLYGNATLQDARVTADSPPGLFASNTYQAGDKLARRPDAMTTVGIEVYPVESVTFGMSGTGVMNREDTGHRDMGDYFVARAYGSWKFTRNAELFGRVENIFDENYDASGIGFSGLPLAAYGGVRLSF